MNKVHTVSALAASLLVTLGVQAADSADLEVKGVITPSACTPSLAGDGVVAFCNIPAESLKPGQYTKLPARRIDLSISCESATKIALKVTDNRKTSTVWGIANDVSESRIGNAYNFGLGSVEGKDVGGYVLSLSAQSTTDGKITKKIFSVDGTSWHPGTADLRSNGADYLSFGDGRNQPVSFKQITLKIDVKVMLNKPENLPLTQDVPLDGSATIEVVYL